MLSYHKKYIFIQSFFLLRGAEVETDLGFSKKLFSVKIIITIFGKRIIKYYALLLKK